MVWLPSDSVIHKSIETREEWVRRPTVTTVPTAVVLPIRTVTTVPTTRTSAQITSTSCKWLRMAYLRVRTSASIGWPIVYPISTLGSGVRRKYRARDPRVWPVRKCSKKWGQSANRRSISRKHCFPSLDGFPNTRKRICFRMWSLGSQSLFSKCQKVSYKLLAHT